jgi:hypothetical protein
MLLKGNTIFNPTEVPPPRCAPLLPASIMRAAAGNNSVTSFTNLGYFFLQVSNKDLLALFVLNQKMKRTDQCVPSLSVYELGHNFKKLPNYHSSGFHSSFSVLNGLG